MPRPYRKPRGPVQRRGRHESPYQPRPQKSIARKPPAIGSATTSSLYSRAASFRPRSRCGACGNLTSERRRSSPLSARARIEVYLPEQFSLPPSSIAKEQKPRKAEIRLQAVLPGVILGRDVLRTSSRSACAKGPCTFIGDTHRRLPAHAVPGGWLQARQADLMCHEHLRKSTRPIARRFGG